MKTLSNHIKESFTPVKEEQQTVVENQTDNTEEVVNEDESVEKEKPSEQDGFSFYDLLVDIIEAFQIFSLIMISCYQ